MNRHQDHDALQAVESALSSFTPLPPNEYAPTPKRPIDYAQPKHRQPEQRPDVLAIDGIVADICNDIHDVRALLDVIERQVLESAANAKHQMREQVDVCAHVKDEIVHMRRVISTIQERGKALQP
jgi:hypothetical protein